MLKTQQSSKT